MDVICPMALHRSQLFSKFSHRITPAAKNAPTSCANTNAGASIGRIPANVSLAVRARVTAGLAKDVEAVNQYAAVIYAPTAAAMAGKL